ncbi:inovirus-type Gp2 protein [uncultured Tolumonas sp.]|uniref:YagK/YfjJ domain-containing protein n=1 Tax=uncultured Tolumonas sp. TaxID=263765 RepID=UPI002A0A9996|nr:inovirus-type Gp2 protein [uncultured Tolumonas sp.]
MCDNKLLIKALDLPEKLNSVGYPYLGMTMQTNSRKWDSYLGSYPIFDLLEEVANQIKMNQITDAQHPTIQLLVDLMMCDFLVWELASGVFNFAPRQALLHALNEFLDKFRLISNSDKFKKRLLNLKRVESRNKDSMREYIDQLFNCYSRLLVIRVDFHYRESIASTVTLEQSIQDRELFLCEVKKDFGDLIGLCWKLEHGRRRAFHYHMVFFFNGANVRQDITIGKCLGEQWIAITNSQGTYHNCNANKDRYKESCLGLVDYDDEDKRHAMRHLEYLVKQDEEVIALQLRGCARTFGRMETPQRTTRAGRPRRYVSLI